MNNIFIYLSAMLFLATSCKKDSVINETKISYEQQDVKNKNLNNNQKTTCEDIIYNIVKSSSLKLNDYKNYFVRVDAVKGDSITVKVYVENNLSDNPKQKQIVESVIAWLLFLPNEEKLFNITTDP